MSFSSDVKEELTEYMPKARHCQIAEIAAVIVLCGRIRITETGGYRLLIHTENIYTVRKFYELLREAFDIRGEVSIRKNISKNSLMYTILVKDEAAREVLEAIKLLSKEGSFRDDYSLVSNMIVQSICCKKAFLRGAFLASGSASDPEKSYHLEIVVDSESKALELTGIFSEVGIKAKLIKRKNH